MKTVIVAYDFSKKSDIAMQHALMIAQKTAAQIRLVHVVEYMGDKHKKEQKLREAAGKYVYEYGILPVVIHGSLTSALNKYADNIKALMVILGTTTKLEGMESIFGNRTLKIISGGLTPFLIAQDFPKKEKLKNILFPVNFTRENKEKLLWVKVLGGYYDLNIELFVQNDTDELVNTRIRANLLFAKRYLEKHKIRYSITLAEEEISFLDAVLDRAKETAPDIIMIMVSSDFSLYDHIMGTDEQRIIANGEKIPIMCINPRLDLIKYSGFF